MNKYLGAGLAVAGLVIIAVPVSTSARSETEVETEHNTTIIRNATETVRGSVEGVRSTVDGATTRVTQSDVAEKRAAIEQKIAERRAEISEKLSGKRKDACNRKEETINAVLDRRATAAERHLAVFNSIRDRLVEFVNTKQLSVENAAALEVIMSDKQAAAQAAVDAAKATDFSCDDTSSSSPGKVVTELVSDQKQALKEYRTAIKDYAVAVKSAAQNASEDSAEASNE